MKEGLFSNRMTRAFSSDDKHNLLTVLHENQHGRRADIELNENVDERPPEMEVAL